MVWKFFAYIWGAIILMMFLFAASIRVLDWGPPDTARAKVELRMVLRELNEISNTRGEAATAEYWDIIAPAHPMLLLSAAPCSDEDTVRIGAGCKALSVVENEVKPLMASAAVWFPIGLGALTSALAAIALSRRLSRSINMVQLALKDLASGILTTRIRPRLCRGDHELADLAQAFDDAASQLQGFAESRRGLLHDISHEIRSPLARLRAAIALLEVSPDKRETLTAQMSTDIARMDHLIDEILTLSRLQAQEIGNPHQPLDLLDLLEPIIDDARFEGQDRQVSVTYAGPDSLHFEGNPELLHRAFENIVRNAITYSPDGAIVEIVASEKDGRRKILVSDRGPGVAEHELDAIFKPFMRLGQPSRSKGVGLGMAIASRSVQIHGGTLTAARRDGGGLTISIVL